MIKVPLKWINIIIPLVIIKIISVIIMTRWCRTTLLSFYYKNHFLELAQAIRREPKFDFTKLAESILKEIADNEMKIYPGLANPTEKPTLNYHTPKYQNEINEDSGNLHQPNNDTTFGTSTSAESSNLKSVNRSGRPRTSLDCPGALKPYYHQEYPVFHDPSIRSKFMTKLPAGSYHSRLDFGYRGEILSAPQPMVRRQMKVSTSGTKMFQSDRTRPITAGQSLAILRNNMMKLEVGSLRTGGETLTRRFQKKLK